MADETVSRPFEVKKQGSVCPECHERISLNSWAVYYRSGHDKFLVHRECAPLPPSATYEPLPADMRARNLSRLQDARKVLDES
jgi:hypothetical protein